MSHFETENAHVYYLFICVFAVVWLFLAEKKTRVKGGAVGAEPPPPGPASARRGKDSSAECAQQVRCRFRRTTAEAFGNPFRTYFTFVPFPNRVDGIVFFCFQRCMAIGKKLHLPYRPESVLTECRGQKTKINRIE